MLNFQISQDGVPLAIVHGAVDKNAALRAFRPGGIYLHLTVEEVGDPVDVAVEVRDRFEGRVGRDALDVALLLDAIDQQQETIVILAGRYESAVRNRERDIAEALREQGEETRGVLR